MRYSNNFVCCFARAISAAFLASLVVLTGCHKDAGPKTEVLGKVMYKGSPVSGTLTFNPDTAGGLPYTVPSGNDGAFTSKGVAPGSYTVTVLSGAPAGPPGQKAPSPYGGKPPPGADQGIRDMLPPGATGGGGVAVPPKYTDAKKSDWKVTINEGKNDLGTFELKD